MTQAAEPDGGSSAGRERVGPTSGPGSGSDRSSAPALEARGVSVSYGAGRLALEDVSISVRTGETLAIVGESGSGKTTLLRCWNRLIEPRSGEIRIAGRSAKELDPVNLRRATGYVPQDGGLLPHWTVARNVSLVPALIGWPKQSTDSAVGRALRLVGLPLDEFGDRYPRSLSGGQRQRVAVARAIAADPEVVLLDEPFGALDAISRVALQREALSWKLGLGKTLVLVTHDLREAFALGDRVLVMRSGRVEQVGPPDEIRRHPLTPYVRELVTLAVGAVD
ncbi:MAG: ATP-binding cassette domain-containing protein [Candidatus Eisenbacteria bacterium]|nr:ATP-binding cassette domain-containing protein [Candidatus Eisenbacteria bacterium]